MYVLENKDGFIKSWFSFGNGKKKTIINTDHLTHAVIFHRQYDAELVAKSLKASVKHLKNERWWLNVYKI